MKHPTQSQAESVVHLQVLEALDGSGHVSQRAIGEGLGMAPSRVNRTIRTLVQAGHVEVADESVRPFAYRLTPAGRDYLGRLNYVRYARVVERYRAMEDRIRERLGRVREMGAERLAFYGAGEVMEVAYPIADSLGFQVVAVVDDDPAKWRSVGSPAAVKSPATLRKISADAVVITTFRHASEIFGRMDVENLDFDVVQL